MDIIGFLKSQFICHLLICYIFIASGLIVNIIQLFTLPIWPINKSVYRRINCRLGYCIASHIERCTFQPIFCNITGVPKNAYNFQEMSLERSKPCETLIRKW